MKARNKHLLQCLACLTIAAAYFFLSYTPLQTELHLRPEWTCDISKTPEPAAQEALLPFRLGNKGGYFTNTGKIVTIVDIPYKAIFSKNFFALYGQDAEEIQIFKPNGNEAFSIKAAGFPYIQDSRVFLFEPGGSTLSFVNDSSGIIESTWEYSAPITAFNSSPKGSVAGYADGQLAIFDQYGKKKSELAPGGSDYQVILGADISENGEFFACVCGLDPQRFVLYKDEGNYKKIIYHEFLSVNLTRQTKVYFSKNDRYVYFDSIDALGIVDTKSAEAIHVPLKGTILDIQESPVDQSVFVLSRYAQKYYTITILEEWTKKIGQFAFEADAAFILSDGTTLYVGRDNKISRLSISKS